MASVVSDGIYVYLWPANGDWGPLEPAQCAAQIAALGITGVIPQNNLDVPVWLNASRVAGYRTAGLNVGGGLGSLGPSKWQALADATIATLKLSGVAFCSPDQEDAWAGFATEAANYENAVYNGAPDDSDRVVPVPWAKPNEHDKYPTQILSRLPREQGPQVYGGSTYMASASLLAFARQWYGKRFPDRIFPTVQAYRRTVADYETMADEPVIWLWDWMEMDGSCKSWLACRLALRRRGFVGVAAVGDFQKYKGLTVDYILGPATAAALGVSVYPGTQWTGNYQ